MLTWYFLNLILPEKLNLYKNALIGACIYVGIIHKMSKYCIENLQIHVSKTLVQNFDSMDQLALQWLVCVPLGIHLEPINKDLMLLVTI